MLGVQGAKAWEAGRPWQDVLRNYSPAVMKSRVSVVFKEQTKPLENGKTFSRSVKDITDKYTNKNKPSTGKLVYDKDYDVNKNVEEVEIAKWIHENIGGNIKLLTAVNEQNKKTADYLWNGKLWDLKSITTEKSADSSIRKGVKQIVDNPGGIILLFNGEKLDINLLKDKIIYRIRRSMSSGMEVLVLHDMKIVLALRYGEI